MEEYQDHSLGSRVFQKIRDNILNGIYKENDELRETAIGKELGVFELINTILAEPKL